MEVVCPGRRIKTEDFVAGFGVDLGGTPDVYRYDHFSDQHGHLFVYAAGVGGFGEPPAFRIGSGLRAGGSGAVREAFLGRPTLWVLTSAGSAGWACVSFTLLNGAQGPVTVGTPSTHNQPNVAATTLSAAQSYPVSCAAGSVLVMVQFPAGSATGSLYFISFPLTDSVGTTGQVGFEAMVSTLGQLSINPPSTVLSVMQGSSAVAPITVSSQSFSGTAGSG
jgi:hypothetical protein